MGNQQATHSRGQRRVVLLEGVGQPSEPLEADIEKGPDGEYYIRRKLLPIELRALQGAFSEQADGGPFDPMWNRSAASTSSGRSRCISDHKDDARAVHLSASTGNSEHAESAPAANEAEARARARRRQMIRDYAAAKRKQSSNNVELAQRHPPFFITFISLFQLVAFVYYALRSDEPLTLTGPVPYQSKLIYNPARRYELWRYLTYMFIHAGYWHIAFNILIQLAVGIPLEVVHKFTPILVIYLGGVLAGALGNSLADPHSYLAGASSGCYALIAAHIANLIINWSEIPGACCRLFTLLLFTGADLGTAIYERHALDLRNLRPHKVSYAGHLAGALSGLLLGLQVLRNARVHSWEREVRKYAFAIYVTALLFALYVNLAHPDYFPLPDTRDLIWTASPFSFEREQ